MGVSKSDSVIIVGGGAFGLSTALHLSQKGYTNISVFEKDSNIPPRFSAANDLNKIVRAEYEDDFYTDLTIVRPSLPFCLDARVLIRDSTFRKLSMRGKLLCSRPISTRRVSCTACRGRRHRKPLIL